MSDGLTVGVVGAGAIAQVAHLPVLSRMDDVTVIAMCDNDRAKAQALASRFDVPNVYDDIQDLLKYATPDVVAICTPNHLHEIHVKTALSEGVHVFCERPLALGVEGVRAVLDAANGSPADVMVGMNHRYRTDVQAVLGFLRRGELGGLLAVRSGWYAFRPARQALGWRRRPQQSGGGVLFDLGLPLIDLAVWLSNPGGPFHVTASMAGAEDGGVEDVGCAMITCGRGLSLLIDVTWSYVGEKEQWWCEVLGTEGSAMVAPLGVYKEMHGSSVNVTPRGIQGRESVFTASYHSQWASFAAAIRGVVEFPDLADQLLTHRIMEAVYTSAKAGATIKVET